MDFFDQVKTRLPRGFSVSAKHLTRAVFELLSDTLAPDEAAALEEGFGKLLPKELRSLLNRSAGARETMLSRDEFVEALASRLDLDDGDAEVGAGAVLMTLREILESRDAAAQLLERLPPDLQQMMEGAASF